ncbi:hypothetical protein ACMGGS_06860 [Superficieibacter sp. BNK-5]|uniref:hypothetical protein n=1 Tax=Superficieibacter sp. BNK-5 TaxID=3376142 RepID=UPI0039BFDA61
MSSTGGKGVWGKMRGIGVLACRAALRLRGLQVLRTVGPVSEAPPGKMPRRYA